MEPSEQVNLPMWQGQPGHFEIWFVVAIDQDAARATWVRYTTFSPLDGPPRAAVWAADFDARRDPPTIWAKSTHTIDAYTGATDRFSVRIGDSEIHHGHCTGKVASAGHRIVWELEFAVGTAPVRRTPAVLEQLRLSTTAVHACADAPVSGWVETDGVRRQITSGKAVQMHLYGTRRVDNLSWIWAPALDHGEATLEVLSAQMRRPLAGMRGPHMTSVFLRHGDQLEDLTQLPDALLPSSSSPAPGVLDVTWTGVRRALRIRGFAPPGSYAGWVYRNTGGRELHVAQSDIATCVVESFRRSHPLGKWRPQARLISRQGAAVELHGDTALEGVRYVGWDESEPLPAEPAPRLTHRAPVAAGAGELIEVPSPRAIVAAGLTYRSHRAELGLPDPGPEGPPMFLKQLASWNATGGTTLLPSFRALCAAAEAVEPGLGEALRERFPTLPVLLDHEVELGIAVLAPAKRGELAAGKLPRIGWFVANDLTARTLELLGEGREPSAPYGSAARSFPGFLPVLAQAWVPMINHDEPPNVTLRTSVNGHLRQEARSSDLALRPSQLLSCAAAALGRDLDVGDLILTGTPAGVALRVPRWKRRLSRVLDRYGKLDAALQRYVEGAGFLRAGDRVTVEADFLGARTVEIDVEAAD
jgi:2-keto-4-pentenoate hydratase/2-oxohepta-3-ene-1,7-dioic acid hydratase in catechol pathway